MIKATTIIAAAFALSAQGALAGPMTVSEGAGNSNQKSEKSLVSSLVDQLKLSMSVLRNTAGESSKKSTEYKSRAQKQCEQAVASNSEREDGGDVKKGEPVGPEPIYFGF